MKPKTLHFISLYFGIILTATSVFSAILLNYSHFYTTFAVGTWLVLDYLDYKLSNNSILGYFYNKKHRDAFLLFFVLATIFCFLIDFVYGVQLTKMWTWVDYKTIHFIRMFIFMNAAFVLSMYSLYRVTRILIKRKIKEKNLLNFEFKKGKKELTYSAFFFIGLLGMFLPTYILILDTEEFIEYAMFFPFLGMFLITDAITYYLNGKPFFDLIIKFNNVTILSIAATILFAVPITEFINIFADEWKYTLMPFEHITILGIPVAVFIGWIPLILGSMSLVNMIKHLDYVKDKKD